MIGTILYFASKENCRMVKDSVANIGNSPVSCNLNALVLVNVTEELTRYREYIFVVGI